MTTKEQTLTNKMQTLASAKQTRTNFLPTTRKSQMIYLSVLTAITLIGQYVMLGEAGLSKQILGEQFEKIELVLWGARALVEVFVVIYIAMTKANTEQEANALNRFKIALIVLIILTVGPVWVSKQYSVTNLDPILTVYGVYFWGFAIAGISAIMLWGVATAYKYQPADDDCFLLPVAQYNKMLEIVSESEIKMLQALADVDTMMVERDKAIYELNGMKEAVAVFRFLPASAAVQIIAMFANGRPDSASLAEAFGISESTIRGVFARIEK